MKMLLLLLLFALPVIAQSDLPDKGSIDELRGKTKFYLITDDAFTPKHILPAFRKLAIENVGRADDAEFFIEYRTLRRPDRAKGASEAFFEEGQMDIYFRRGDRKVVVWSEAKLGLAPYKSLAKKAAKILSFK